MAITTNAELITAVENWIQDTTINARVLEFIALGEEDIWRDVRVRAMEAAVDLRLERAQDGGDAGGTANALTASVSPAPTALGYGDTVTFTATANNTGAATLNLNSLGATNIRKGDGTVALEANDIIDDFDYTVYYDGTQWRLTPTAGAVPLPSRYLGTRRIFLADDPNRPLEFVDTDTFHKTYMSTRTARPVAYTVEGDFIVFGPAPDATYPGRHLYWRRPTAISSAVPRLFSDGNAGLWLYAALKHSAPYLANDPRALTWAALYDQAVEDIHKADRRDRMAGAGKQMRGVSGP